MMTGVDAMLGGVVTTVKALSASSALPRTTCRRFTTKRSACSRRSRHGRR
jgi:hypothetical protein